VTLEADNKKLPSYEQPPVTEVACSVLFPPIKGLFSPYLGLLWQRFQPEYPFCNDVAPIAPSIEIFDEQDVELKINLTSVPPLPRVWFINQDETKLIQVQPDRFIHNWRKIDEKSKYPRYDSLIKDFQKHLIIFDNFIAEADLERIQPRQYELTYVNEIPQGQTWLTPEDIGRIFPDIDWKASSSRFLVHPQNLDWSTVFELPNQQGRLRASVKTIILDKKSTLFFELTARGVGNYTSSETLRSWFDMAHEWIVRAFSDLTKEEVQINTWKRRE
jgi:uncharacterized protein (TIGR04255 family)